MQLKNTPAVGCQFRKLFEMHTFSYVFQNDYSRKRSGNYKQNSKISAGSGASFVASCCLNLPKKGSVGTL